LFSTIKVNKNSIKMIYIFVYYTSYFLSQRLLNDYFWIDSGSHLRNPLNPDLSIVRGRKRGETGAANCVCERTHMTIADHNRFVDVIVLWKSKELCFNELWDKSFGRVPQGNSNEKGGVDRLAIRNFGHVGISWSTCHNGYSWDGGIRLFHSRRSRFMVTICDQDCVSGAKNDFDLPQLYFIPYFSHSKRTLFVIY